MKNNNKNYLSKFRLSIQKKQICQHLPNQMTWIPNSWNGLLNFVAKIQMLTYHVRGQHTNPGGVERNYVIIPARNVKVFIDLWSFKISKSTKKHCENIWEMSISRPRTSCIYWMNRKYNFFWSGNQKPIQRCILYNNS